MTYTPWEGDGHEVGYDLGSLYPGLAALSYKTLEGGASGHLIGLAGGPLNGGKENGQWYYPLGEFLKRAAPSGFANGFRPDGSVVELDLEWGQYVLTVAATDKPVGEVHDKNGKTVLNVAMINRDDGPWLTLPDLARLFDLLAWGVLTPDGKLLVAAPFIP
ncbi:MAG: hypothetical protein ACYC5Y_15875 [Symbiobacteriia bacterium]